MTALVYRRGLAEGLSDIFAAADGDFVQALLRRYADDRAKVERIAAIFDERGELAPVVRHFIDGNDARNGHVPISVSRLFALEGALADLNARYWDRLLESTDVLSVMPEKRREEWRDTISKRTTPDFDASTVVATLGELLAMRGRFFAERVDGVFRELSGEHVTNSPSGFRRRMIIANVVDAFNCNGRVGYINDLRAVIAKFMGRDEPRWDSSKRLVDYARSRHWDWLTVDGGAMRIRVYKKGTAHIEVHDEIAWRLNAVLHSLYPNAIPSEHRTRPSKKPKAVELMLRPLPFAVLALLGDVRDELYHGKREAAVGYRWHGADKHVRSEARQPSLRC